VLLSPGDGELLSNDENMASDAMEVRLLRSPAALDAVSNGCSVVKAAMPPLAASCQFNSFRCFTHTGLSMLDENVRLRLGRVDMGSIECGTLASGGALVSAMPLATSCQLTSFRCFTHTCFSMLDDIVRLRLGRVNMGSVECGTLTSGGALVSPRSVCRSVDRSISPIHLSPA